MKPPAKLGIKTSGTSYAFELAIRFVEWAAQRKRDPTAADIRARFDVSRATSYRWRAAFIAAKGRIA